MELSEGLCLLYRVQLNFTVCSWNILQVLLQTAVPVVQKLTKDSIGTRNKDSEEGTGNNTGPTTTVFVGNISEKASDVLVRQLLAVSVWKLFYKFYLRSNAKSQTHHLYRLSSLQKKNSVFFYSLLCHKAHQIW